MASDLLDMTYATLNTVTEIKERQRYLDGRVLALIQLFNGLLGRELTYLAARCGQPRHEESASDRDARQT